MKSFDPSELVDYAEQIAQQQVEDMSQEACIEMVRSYTALMSKWQSNVQELAEEPVALAIACLTLSHLYQKAFCEGYSFTERRMEATEAIEKALGGSL